MRVLIICSFILSTFAACGISEEIYQRDVTALKEKLAKKTDAHSMLSKQCKELQGAHDALKLRSVARAGKLERRVAQCLRELDIVQSKGGTLDTKLKQALTQIARLEELAAKQRSVFDRLRQALSALVRAGKLQVAIVRGQFTVQLRDKILFDVGQSYLNKEGKETLSEVARALAGLPGRRFQVAGHTDTIGSKSGNWKLSGERAWSVTKTLIKEGMPSARISFAGYGQFQPAASNEDDESRALNRRIEIVLIPDMEEIMAPLTDTPKG